MRVHHIALRTRDVARLVRFYRDLVGLEEAQRDAASRSASVWLSADETLIMVEPMGEEEPPVPAGSMEMLAFAIAPSERTVFEASLAAAHVVIEARTAFTLYFRDPDGRRVGVSHFPTPG